LASPNAGGVRIRRQRSPSGSTPSFRSARTRSRVRVTRLCPTALIASRSGTSASTATATCPQRTEPAGWRTRRRFTATAAGPAPSTTPRPSRATTPRPTALDQPSPMKATTTRTRPQRARPSAQPNARRSSRAGTSSRTRDSDGQQPAPTRRPSHAEAARDGSHPPSVPGAGVIARTRIAETPRASIRTFRPQIVKTAARTIDAACLSDHERRTRGSRASAAGRRPRRWSCTRSTSSQKTASRSRRVGAGAATECGIGRPARDAGARFCS
jgi:hypothetical protein